MKIEEMTVGDGKKYLNNHLRSNKARGVFEGILNTYVIKANEDIGITRLKWGLLSILTFLVGLFSGLQI